MQTASSCVAADGEARNRRTRTAMNNGNLLIHVGWKAERLAQTDIGIRLEAVIRKPHIRRADVKNHGGGDQVSHPNDRFLSSEALGRIRIVCVNSIVHWCARLVQ